MSEPDARPDPDAILRRVQEEETRARRAKLKIFFGFAPGVGKTYRMLQVARDLLIEEKPVDVVVGVVETHGRFDTGALLLGLEILPRQRLEYRGRTLEEFDLDGALARRPNLLLVDELAHTNVPGSRHAKRWQDVLELLDAGIDVYTTVNIQHVESLNDVIAQITGIHVRETIPDSMLERADEIELVDIAPEELLTRLREGKVYLPEQARRAADQFFRHGNLLALRELALRRIAQHVDEDVREFREQHGVVATWPTGERILVCVGPAPSSGRLIRTTTRLAAGLRAPWVAAWVETIALAPLNDADRERLEEHLRLAESLGGSVVRLSGSSAAQALLEYARKQNVTRIVIGKPTHSRLRDRLRGSLLDDVVRGSGDIDVLVISGDPEEERSAPSPAAIAPATAWTAWLVAAALAGVATGVGWLLQRVMGVPDIEMLYLLAVGVAGLRLGRGPALLTAGLSVAAFDFLFVPPFLTFRVADLRYLLTFAMMFGVGVVLSELTARLRRQEQDARGREERTGALYALSTELAGAAEPAAVLDVTARLAGRALEAQAFGLRPDGSGALVVVAAYPSGSTLERNELGVARWVFEHGRPAGFGTDTLPGSRSLAVPLGGPEGSRAVLALLPEKAAPLRAEQRSFLEALTRQGTLALERARLIEEARAAAVRARTEEMRSSLLSAVSHDLRTPLAAITGAATALRDGEVSPASRRDLVETVCEEAERLERQVRNLLDMTQLDSGRVDLRREWVPLEEIVGSTLARLEKLLGDRDVRVALARDLPLVWVDPILIEQLLVNLLENAVRYAPDGPLEIEARRVGEQLELCVSDQGPGLPAEIRGRAFEKFVRGPKSAARGVGLGLAICRGVAEAHGGTIAAEDREGGGTRFRLTLPLAKPPSATS
jgi:two-component system sensor histidine kinase KdpD